MIASGLLFMQTSDEQTDGRVTKLREQLLRVLADKHEAGLCRFGAILAFGLLDAGGRNSTAAMNEKLKMPKNFVVRSEARPSLFAYPEATKPAQKDEGKTKGTKVQLSTTKRTTSRAGKKDGEDEEVKTTTVKEKATKLAVASDAVSNPPSTFSMAGATIGTSSVGGDDKLSVQGAFEIDEGHPCSNDRETMDGSLAGDAMEVDKEEVSKDKDIDMDGEKDEKTEEEKKAEAKEPSFEVLSNPCRVVPAQELCIRYYARGRTVSMSQPAKEGDEKPALPSTVVTRYEPVNKERKNGFLLLRDLDAGSPEDILEFAGYSAKEEEEPSPPEPFAWSG